MEDVVGAALAPWISTLAPYAACIEPPEDSASRAFTLRVSIGHGYNTSTASGDSDSDFDTGEYSEYVDTRCGNHLDLLPQKFRKLPRTIAEFLRLRVTFSSVDDVYESTCFGCCVDSRAQAHQLESAACAVSSVEEYPRQRRTGRCLDGSVPGICGVLRLLSLREEDHGEALRRRIDTSFPHWVMRLTLQRGLPQYDCGSTWRAHQLPRIRHLLLEYPMASNTLEALYLEAIKSSASIQVLTLDGVLQDSSRVPSFRNARWSRLTETLFGSKICHSLKELCIREWVLLDDDMEVVKQTLATEKLKTTTSASLACSISTLRLFIGSTSNAKSMIAGLLFTLQNHLRHTRLAISVEDVPLTDTAVIAAGTRSLQRFGIWHSRMSK